MKWSFRKPDYHIYTYMYDSLPQRSLRAAECLGRFSHTLHSIWHTAANNPIPLFCMYTGTATVIQLNGKIQLKSSICAKVLKTIPAMLYFSAKTQYENPSETITTLPWTDSETNVLRWNTKYFAVCKITAQKFCSGTTETISACFCRLP